MTINYKTKTKIVNYLYNNVKTSLFIQKNIKTVEDLIDIKNNDYYVSANFKTKYVMIFKNIFNVDYSVIISVRDLHDNTTLINYNNIKIIPIKVRVNKKCYEGSIFSGSKIKCDDNFTFVIDDCFFLNGKNMTEMNFGDRFNKGNDFINSISNDSFMTTFNIKLLPLLSYSDLKDIVHNKLKRKEANGLFFIPKKKRNKISSLY